VNGRYVPELSIGLSGEGVEVQSLRSALSQRAEGREAALSLITSGPPNAFVALNTALFDDGALLLLKAGHTVEEPIHLIFYSVPGAEPTVSYPRVLVLAGEESRARIVESYGGSGISLTNAVTEIVAGDGATLEHYRLQRESDSAFHVGTLAARLERGSHLASHAFSLGAALSRTDIDVVFANSGGECVLNGLFMAGGTQHTDTHTRIIHAKPHCTSRELYKGILDDRARGVFTGTIIVEKDAQGTDAYQTNKNLLLSREALVDSTPQLQILANDVKCKHGSTTGQLDQVALFYLRSRGIGEGAARSLLIHAFASEIVQRVNVPTTRAALEAYLRAHLPSASEIHEAVL
jgi:Fe-S cluster assembly protein SufD